MKGKRVIVNAAKKPELSFAFDEFQTKNKVRNLSIATIKGYQDTFNRFSKIIGHDFPCDFVNAKTIDNFVETIMNDGIKAASINHYLRAIRCFLYWCMDEGYIQRFTIRLLKEQETVKDTYSDEQIRALIREPLKLASFVEWRCWAMICWFLATGNRAETVCSIKMSDINMTANEIYINRTKTNKAMIVPMSPQLKQVLKKYISQFRSDASDDKYLFCNVGDKKLTIHGLQCAIRAFNKSRGVELTGIHAFRHTFAKNWIRNTGDVFRLQKLLGHKTLEMTRRYVNMFHEDLKLDYEKYSPLDNICNYVNAKQVVKRRID